MSIKLKELITLKYGKRQIDVEDENGTIPIYGTGGVFGKANISLYSKPSILLGRKGTIDKPFWVDHPFWCVDTMFYSIIDDTKVVPKYLFYNLLNINFSKYNEGTTIPSLRIETLNNIDISLHSNDEQHYIVDILGSIDEKIEKLEKENKEFQKLCLSQFKRYFNNKEKVALNKLATVTMGQSPDGNTINESSGTIFYQGRTDFGFRYPNVRLFTLAPKRMAKEDDILLSVRAPVGDVNVAMENCCIGRGLAAISSNYKHFVFYSLLAQQSDFDVYNNTGTIFGSINREALLSFAVPASDMIDVVKFDSLAETIDSKIKQNVIESIKLKELKALYLQKFFG